MLATLRNRMGSNLSRPVAIIIDTPMSPATAKREKIRHIRMERASLLRERDMIYDSPYFKGDEWDQYQLARIMEQWDSLDSELADLLDEI